MNSEVTDREKKRWRRKVGRAENREEVEKGEGEGVARRL